MFLPKFSEKFTRFIIHAGQSQITSPESYERKFISNAVEPETTDTRDNHPATAPNAGRSFLIE